MKQKRLPTYIAKVIEALDRGEVFDVDPAKLPNGWVCECNPVPSAVTGNPDPHWTVVIKPRNLRRAARVLGTLVLTGWRVGPNSYTVIAPKRLLPAPREQAHRITIEGVFDRAGEFQGVEVRTS